MESLIQNNLGSERSVEIKFTVESLYKYATSNTKVIDIGGIASNESNNLPIGESISKIKCQYDIADFRGGKYTGNFLTANIVENYNIAMFISSLEHFPQCTEGDLIYREGEDKRGYRKALDILYPHGKIILTVPFGKQRWQPYHQNYDWQGILDLTTGSTIIEYYTYRLAKDNYWELANPSDMKDILYTDKAFGVGCFILEKI